jgi:hypothetical protein
MYKIEITETDEAGKQTFRYEQSAEEMDVKAIFDVVNKKPRAPRKDAGIPRKIGPMTRVHVHDNAGA